MSNQDNHVDHDNMELLLQSAAPERLPDSQYRTEIDPSVLTRGQQLTWEGQEAFLGWKTHLFHHAVMLNNWVGR